MFDLICLQEVWKVNDPKLFSIEGYHPLIFKCREGARGGGVGIYVRSNLTFKILDNLSFFKDRILESLVIKITDINLNTFITAALYRSCGPHPLLTRSKQIKQFFKLFDNMLTHINQLDQISYIITDSNFDLLKPDKNVCKYSEMLSFHGFRNTISHPTSYGSLLDHILTNSSYSEFKTGVLSTSQISDHLPTFIMLDLQRTKANKLSPKTDQKVNTKPYKKMIVRLSKLCVQIIILDCF